MSDIFNTLTSRLRDGDAEAATEELIAWMQSAGDAPSAFPNKDAIIQFYWSVHPRFGYIKTVPHNAKMLDVGAGSGALQCWKGWMAPNRDDIGYYANDLSKGEFFENGEGYFVHNLSEDRLEGHESFFDAVFACHVLEHVPEWNPFFDNLVETIKPGGTLYLEWPTTQSASFPRLARFEEVGIPSSTVNFHDDATHLHTAELAEVLPYLAERGMEMTSMGLIQNPYLGAELLKVGARENDAELNTYGLWMALGFSQYIVAKKVD